MARFDFEEYSEELASLKQFAEPEEVELFLLRKLVIIDAPMCSDSRTLDDSPREIIDAEAIEWVKNRLDAQITMRNELATLYREQGDLASSLSVVQDMVGNVIEAELANTPLHAQMLMHEAVAHLELGEGKDALRCAEKAKSIFDAQAYEDASLQAGLTNIIDAAHEILDALK